VRHRSRVASKPLLESRRGGYAPSVDEHKIARGAFQLHLRAITISVAISGGDIEVDATNLCRSIVSRSFRIDWSRIVRNHQHEIRARRGSGPPLSNRQTPPMIVAMNDHDRVLARFDHFVEIADSAVAHRRMLSGPFMPDCFFAFEQETPTRFRRRKIFRTGDCDQSRSRRHAMCSTKRVLAASVGPFKMTGR